MLSADRNLTKRVAADAVFLVLALALSYIEVLIPLGAILPLPGFKLGLANLLVMVLIWCVSAVDGAVLAAANIADNYFKEMEACERLRRQLKEALDESATIKADLSEAKREIFRLSSKK